MSAEPSDENLKAFFTNMRKNDNEKKQAIHELEVISEFYAELGEPEPDLNQFIAEQKLQEQKIDRALTRRGY